MEAMEATEVMEVSYHMQSDEELISSLTLRNLHLVGSISSFCNSDLVLQIQKPVNLKQGTPHMLEKVMVGKFSSSKISSAFKLQNMCNH